MTAVQVMLFHNKTPMQTMRIAGHVCLQVQQLQNMFDQQICKWYCNSAHQTPTQSQHQTMAELVLSHMLLCSDETRKWCKAHQPKAVLVMSWLPRRHLRTCWHLYRHNCQRTCNIVSLTGTNILSIRASSCTCIMPKRQTAAWLERT